MAEGEVIIAAWTGSNIDDEEVHLHEIEAAIAKSGVARSSVRLRLSLNFANSYEDEGPSPELQLVRPETEAECETRKRLQRELNAKFMESNATILSEEAFVDAIKDNFRKGWMAPRKLN